MPTARSVCPSMQPVCVSCICQRNKNQGREGDAVLEPFTSLSLKPSHITYKLEEQVLSDVMLRSPVSVVKRALMTQFFSGSNADEAIICFILSILIIKIIILM